MKILMSSQSKKINRCQSHSHKCCELVVVTKGECITVINDTHYKMKKGTVMLIPPDTEHMEYSDTYYSDIYIQYDTHDIPLELPLTAFI